MARRQLLERGFSARMIRHRLHAGRLLREWPGIYRVGHAAETRNGRWWSAILLAGPGAALSHRSAGEARGWLGAGSLIHVTAPREIEDRGPLRFHRAHRDTEHICGLPVTSPAQTLLDIAATTNRRTLEKALDQASLQHQLDLTSLNLLMGPGARGTTALRAALGTHIPGTTVTRSSHEEAFLGFLDAHGLPRPECNVSLTLPDGAHVKVDALFRSANLVVEIDGPQIHGRPSAIRADHARDLQLKRAGYDVLRLTIEILDPTLAAHLRTVTATRCTSLLA